MKFCRKIEIPRSTLSNLNLRIVFYQTCCEKFKDHIRAIDATISFDVLIDGEALGDTLHAFDLREVKGLGLLQASLHR